MHDTGKMGETALAVCPESAAGFSVTTVSESNNGEVEQMPKSDE